MFKLDKRKDFIPNSNGLASGKVSLTKDINKRISGFNGTNLKTIDSITFESKGMNFILTASFGTLGM